MGFLPFYQGKNPITVNLQAYFKSTVYHKSINRRINIPENRIGKRACINTAKSRLPGIQHILEIDENRKMFPNPFCHQPTNPIRLASAAIAQFLLAVIVSFQANF